MSFYLEPIKTAIFIFPFLALFFTLPFMIHQYRTYGNIPPLRSVIVYSFIFYLLSAFFLVILPLPPRDKVMAMTSSPLQLLPFQFIKDFMRETVLILGDSSTYIPALKQGVVLQPIFNIILVFPFGVYLRYYFKKDFKQTLLFSFLLSLFFEITQLTGIYGIYPKAYRLFDVDDLMMNILGGTLGYLFAPVFTFFLPKRDDIDKKAIKSGESASPIRRGVALIIDQVFLGIFTSTVFIIFSIDYSDTIGIWLNFIFTVVYFIGVTYVSNGKTIGKSVVKIRVRSNNGEPLRFPNVFKRYSIIHIIIPFMGVLVKLTSDLSSWSDTTAYPYLLFISIATNGASLIFIAIIAIYMINALVKKKTVFFYEQWSNTHIASTIKTLKKP